MNLIQDQAEINNWHTSIFHLIYEIASETPTPIVTVTATDTAAYYPNSSYEKRVEGGTETILKYYFARSARIAMRVNGVLTWLLQDQVNSTSVIADASGNLLSEVRYTAFGEIRTTNGITVTDKLYTL